MGSRFAKVLLLLEQLLQTQQIRLDDLGPLFEEEAGSSAGVVSFGACFLVGSKILAWQALDEFRLSVC